MNHSVWRGISLLGVSGLLWMTHQANAGASPFPSSVPGLTIGNAHLVTEGSGQVYRGSEPRKLVSELVDFGITEVLIFKNETRKEVRTEIDALIALGMDPSKIHHIPFTWKAEAGFQAACEEVLSGLQLMVHAYEEPGAKLYLHCTMGEDRTGMMSGLFRMLAEGIGRDSAFRDEMCENGYESGNPKKPYAIAQIIRDEITPLFIKLATAIEQGDLSWRNLDPSVCAQDWEVDTRAYRCSASSKLH